MDHISNTPYFPVDVTKPAFVKGRAYPKEPEMLCVDGPAEFVDEEQPGDQLREHFERSGIRVNDPFTPPKP